MKIISRLILISFLCVIASSCSKRSEMNASDYSEEFYSPRFASGFRILGKDSLENTVLESINPWQGADSVVRRVLIVREGNEIPSGFDGQIIKGSPERIVAMSSTQIALLDAIGEADRIVGVSGIDYISNPEIQARRGSIKDVGFEGNVDYESLIALDPDLVLLYSTNSPSSMEKKLDELGIPYLYVGEYLEEDPLGKAEWIVFLGELTDRRRPAEDTFSRICENYMSLASRVSQSAKTAPKVMLNAPYGDSWFLPPSGSYALKLIRDAGGETEFSDSGRSSFAVDIEEAYRLASLADVWLNPGQARSLDDLKAMCPKFTNTQPFLNGKVFNNNARMSAGGGNDYFESAVVHPDLVLRDLIKILHPELEVEEDFTYYHQLK